MEFSARKRDPEKIKTVRKLFSINGKVEIVTKLSMVGDV